MLALVLSLLAHPILVQAGHDLVLTWDPSPSPEPVEYVLYYGHAGGPTNRLSAGKVNRGKIKNLLSKKKYFIYATAVDQAGLESAPSNFLSYTAPSDSSPPPDPSARPDPGNAPNRAPVLNSIADQTVSAGQVLMYQLKALDQDDNTLTYALVSGPAGATVEPTTGVLIWRVPKRLTAARQEITVRVQDDGTPSLSDTKHFAVTVRGLAAADGPRVALEQANTVTWVTEPVPSQTVRFTLPLASQEQAQDLEVSEDLVHWQRLGSALSTDELLDATVVGARSRFYRVRPVSSTPGAF